MYKCTNNDECNNDYLCCYSCEKIDECKAKRYLCVLCDTDKKPEDCPYSEKVD
jgi:hypothetical protein